MSYTRAHSPNLLFSSFLFSLGNQQSYCNFKQPSASVPKTTAVVARDPVQEGYELKRQEQELLYVKLFSMTRNLEHGGFRVLSPEERPHRVVPESKGVPRKNKFSLPVSKH